MGCCCCEDAPLVSQGACLHWSFLHPCLHPPPLPPVSFSLLGLHPCALHTWLPTCAGSTRRAIDLGESRAASRGRKSVSVLNVQPT